MTSAKVSVVVPSLNAGPTLAHQMGALAQQSIDLAWEIVVVDNGSTDNTSDVALSAPVHPHCTVCVVAEPRRGLNIARNTGIRSASSQMIAICDADDMVDSRWLEAMADCLEDRDVVGGSFRYSHINDARALALRGAPADDRLASSVGAGLGYLPQIVGANVAFRRRVWEAIGGFDEEYSQGGDDVDFGWRAQQLGFSVGYCPDAVVDYRFRSDEGSVWRQYFRDGVGAAHLYARYKASGMPRRPVSAAARQWLWLAWRTPGMRRLTLQERGQYLRLAAKQAGRARGSLRHRVLYL